MRVWLIVFLLSQPALCFVLDGSIKKLRPVLTQGPNGCVANGEAETTAIEESIQSAKCESFAQPIGLVKTFDPKTREGGHGVGTLLAPNAILSSAHVLERCLQEEAKCWFEGKLIDGDTSMIVKVFLSPQYRADTDGDGNDLAIGILNKPLKMVPKIIPLHTADEKFTTNYRAYGASINKIGRNETGTKYSEVDTRHLIMARVKFLNSSFVQPVALQEEDVLKFCEDKKNVVSRFINDPSIFNDDIFLTGILQPGDSGGPLVGQYDGRYEILGVAEKVAQLKCPHPLKKGGKPWINGHNYWVPVYPHLWWIRDVLKENNIDITRYQPELLKLSASRVAGDDKIVTLQSKDGKDFVVRLAQAEKSETLKNLIEDAGTKDPIPLPNIHKNILQIVAAWMNGGEGWERVKAFLDKEGLTSGHPELLRALNYLKIPELLDIELDIYARLFRSFDLGQLKTKEAYLGFKKAYITDIPLDLRRLLVRRLLSMGMPFVPEQEPVVGKVAEFGQNLTDLKVDPLGRWILTSTPNEPTQLWELGVSPRPIRNLETPGMTAVSPDGNWIAVCPNKSAKAHLWQRTGTNWRMVSNITLPEVDDAEPVFSPDSKWLAFWHPRHGHTTLWRVQNGDMHQPAMYVQEAFSPQFSADGLWFLVGGGGVNRLRVEANPHPEILETYPFEGEALRFAVSPANNLFAMFDAEEEGHPQLWMASDQGSGTEPLASLPGCGAQFSADGKLIATIQKGVVRLWKAGKTSDPSSSLFASMQLKNRKIEEFAFSPNGRWVVSIDNQGDVYLWDLLALSVKRPSEEFHPFKLGQTKKAAYGQCPEDIGHANSHFSGDGRWLVISNRDKSATLYAILPQIADIDLAVAQIILYNHAYPLPDFLREELNANPTVRDLFFPPRGEEGERPEKRNRPEQH